MISSKKKLKQKPSHFLFVVIAILLLFTLSSYVQAQSTLPLDRATTIIWSLNGSTIFTGRADGRIEIQDALTGEIIQTLAGHTDWVLSLALSPNEEKLASGSIDKTVRIWDVNSGTLLYTLSGHQDYTFAVTWLDDTTVASGSVEETENLRTWNAQTGQPINATFVNTSFGEFSWSLNRDTLAALTPVGGIQFLSPQTLDATSYLGFQESGVTSIAWGTNTNGIIIASGVMDGTIRIYQMSTGQTVSDLQSYEGQDPGYYTSAIRSLRFTSDGQNLLSIAADGTIQAWQTTTWQTVNTTHINSPIYAASWSPDGGRLAYNTGGSPSQIVQTSTVISLISCTSSPTSVAELRTPITTANSTSGTPDTICLSP